MKRRLEITLMGIGVFYLVATTVTAHSVAVASQYQPQSHPLAIGKW